MHNSPTILGLDIGTVRIGLAKAIWPDGIPSPYLALNNDDQFILKLTQIIEQESVKYLVAGRPRGLSGQETNQTAFVDAFIGIIAKAVALPIYTQDEALTSNKAETELKSRDKPYTKGDIDCLSATYILEDFMREYQKRSRN